MQLSSKVMASISVAGLAFAPLPAHAGTRAASSPVSVDVQRDAQGLEGQSELKGGNLTWLLLLLVALAAVLAAGGGGRSRG